MLLALMAYNRYGYGVGFLRDWNIKLNTMITEEKVVQILKKFEQQDYKLGGVSIDPSNYNAIARTVVKNCSIPDVVGRSEQLKAFADWLQNDTANLNYDFKDLVDEYLESL